MSAPPSVAGTSRNRAIAIGVLLAVVVAAIAWSRAGDKALDEGGITTKVDEPLAPAPDALLADLVIGAPNASWGRLQRGIGGAVGILPSSAGGIICAIAGLDPVLASEIDGGAAAFGVVAGDPASPSVLFAVKLADLRKMRSTLVNGETARYASRDAGGMTELIAKGSNTPAPLALGISPSGYLLIARTSEELGRLGPYVSRTLPKRRLPAEGAIVIDVPKAALAALVKPKLEVLWAGLQTWLLGEDDRMRRTRGRAPDFGDPKAIVAALDGWVTRRIAIVADLEKLRVAIDFGDDGVSILATMTPNAAGGVAATWTDAMKLGDTAPLAVLPRASAVALLLRDDENDRADQAREAESLVTRALGDRLADGDAKKLHDIGVDYTKARADVLGAALLWDNPQGLLVRGTVRDADAATRFVRGAVELARSAPFKDVLRAREVSVANEDVAGLGKISLATVVREPRKEPSPSAPARPRGDAGAGPGDAGAKRPTKDQLGLAWIVDAERLTLATGELPTATLGAGMHPDQKLGDEPVLARMLAALGADMSGVLIVQPLRFDPMRANLPAAPLTLALGRKEKNAVLRIDVGHGLLREFARWQMGL